jgi:flagellar basal body-associated protein FliL
MVNNYTPLDIEKLKKEKDSFNTILLLIVTLTMAVLAILLFILIQKKIKEQNQLLTQPTSTIKLEPTETPTSLSPTVFEKEITPTFEASETPMLSVTPASESYQISR